MGLLAPSAGRILVDGADLHDPRIRSVWQLGGHRLLMCHRAFTWQTVQLPRTLLWSPKASTEYCRVKEAAEIAQISKFIEDNPEGYNTTVGEKGVRLSGGQSQRIGIARAWYKNASIFVFDEATSALDSDTEFRVMNSIDKLESGLTVINIAHRTSTLRNWIKFQTNGVAVDYGPPVRYENLKFHTSLTLISTLF